MDIQIVKADEKYWESHAETLDQVARERRFLSFLEGPPKQEVRDFVKKLIALGDTQYFAIHGDRAIGWCDITRNGSTIQAHSGGLGMGLRKEYRGIGLGKKLIQATIADAEAKGLERIELTVFDRNQSAIALYLKCGFKVEGKLEKFVKVDGVYRSALLMSRIR